MNPRDDGVIDAPQDDGVMDERGARRVGDPELYGPKAKDRSAHHDDVLTDRPGGAGLGIHSPVVAFAPKAGRTPAFPVSMEDSVKHIILAGAVMVVIAAAAFPPAPALAATAAEEARK